MMDAKLSGEPPRMVVILFWILLAIISLIVFYVVMPTVDYDPFVEEAVPPPYTDFKVPEGTILKIDFPPEANRGRLFFASPGSLPDANLLLPGFRVTILHENSFSEDSFLLRRTISWMAAGVFAGALVKLIFAGLKWKDLGVKASLMAILLGATAMTVVTIQQPSTPGDWLPAEAMFSKPILVMFHLWPALLIELFICPLRWLFGKLMLRQATLLRRSTTPTA